MLKNNAEKKCIGFSLVELLIGLLLGSILLSMMVNLYMIGISTGTKNIKASRLGADLKALVHLLENDIRRAGFGGEDYLVGASGAKVVDINSAQNCIVYSYNHNDSQMLERSNKMAFALKNHAIKFKTGVIAIADVSCANASGWTTLSDDNFVKITKLIFTEKNISNALSTARNIKIELSGELVSDNNYRHSLSTSVQVRNTNFND